jgi:two-component system, OmpR family, phosphate regulon response regulator OmpR
MNTIKMIVVDDEKDICETLSEYFLMQGYDVKMANNGHQLKSLLNEFTPHIVLLDLNMPGEDGLSLTRYLREHTRAAIIIVTAASSQVDMIVGLEMGADDYIGKPFDLRELLARVKSVLRRTHIQPEQLIAQPPIVTELAAHIHHIGKCVLDSEQRKLWEGEQEISLTSMEYDLLMVMVTHPNRPLSRDQLLTLAHKTDADAFDRSIDSRITRLRKKIEIDPEKPAAIKTVRGVGYVFVP